MRRDSLAMHCSTAIREYSNAARDDWAGDEALILRVFSFRNVRSNARSRHTGLTTVAEVTSACNAGGGCGSCHQLIQEITSQKMTNQMIYLDNNATTRVAPEVFDAMQPYLTELFGNPSSAHTLGRTMKQAVENAREHVASLIGASDSNEIIFTSCGSESDNWAIRGALAFQPEKKHIVTTLVEHEAVETFASRSKTKVMKSHGWA